MLGLRLLPGEKAELQTLASAAGLSVADFIRARCLGATVAASPERRDLVRVEVALNRIGGNVNQLAHVANVRGVVTDDQIDRATKLLEEALQIVAAELRR